MATSLRHFLNRAHSRHYTGYNHPEGAGRLEALITTLEARDSDIEEVDGTRDPKPSVVHTQHYLDRLDRVTESLQKVSADLEITATAVLDEDTFLAPGSVASAYDGLRLQEQAIEYLFETGERRCAFVLSRPPGHHALSDNAMGFCLFNTNAYGARYAQQIRRYAKRVVILDWDVHHGNGTEEIFYDTDEVFTISTHQQGHWPYGIGNPEDKGAHDGLGFNLNIPMPVGSGDREFEAVLSQVIIPRITDYAPDLIMVGCGFDAHVEERNSGTNSKSLLSLSDWGFARMTELLLHRTTVPLLFSLEGGYNLPSLQSGFAVVCDTITGGALPAELTPAPAQAELSTVITELIESYTK